jgi:Flp pilus assembly protein TadB
MMTRTNWCNRVCVRVVAAFGPPPTSAVLAGHALLDAVVLQTHRERERERERESLLLEFIRTEIYY